MQYRGMTLMTIVSSESLLGNEVTMAIQLKLNL